MSETGVSDASPSSRKSAKKAQAEFSLTGEPSPKSSRKSDDYTPEYEAFWKAYPDRNTGMSKWNGFQAWRTLKPAQQEMAMQSLPKWRAIIEDRKRKSKDHTTLHVQGFLNQRRFESLVGDVDASSVAPGASAAQAAAAPNDKPWWRDLDRVAQITIEQWKGSIRKHANGTWPVGKLGPPPGDRECRVPRELLDAWRIEEKYDHRGLRRRGVADFPFRDAE